MGSGYFLDRESSTKSLSTGSVSSPSPCVRLGVLYVGDPRSHPSLQVCEIIMPFLSDKIDFPSFCEVADVLSRTCV